MCNYEGRDMEDDFVDESLIEGYVKQFQNPRDSVTINRNIKVSYGNEDRIDNPSTRARIIHIDGSIHQLCVNVSNVEMEVVLKGDCDIVNVDNCLYCKGVVENIKAGNAIYCTMGKSKGKTKRELQREQEKLFADMFGGTFNRK